MSENNSSAEIRDLIILIVVGLGLFMLAKILVASFVLFMIIGIALAVGAFFIVKHPMSGISNTAIKAAFKLVAVAIVVAWFYRGFGSIPSDVYVDNFTGTEVEVYNGASHWLTISADTSIKVTTYPGNYTFIVKEKESGDVLDSIVAVVGKSNVYILNCGGEETYYLGKAVYGIGSGEDEEKEITDSWFEVDVNYLFKEPPSTVSVREGVSSTSRTYILRSSDVLKDMIDSGEIDFDALLKSMGDSLGVDLDSLGDDDYDDEYEDEEEEEEEEEEEHEHDHEH